MNIKQLIESTKKTVSNLFDTKKDFRNKSIGQIIQIDTSNSYDKRGILNMVMYITAATQKFSAVQSFYKPDRRKKEIYQEPRKSISTHTVGISFSDYYRITLSLSEITNNAFKSVDDRRFNAHVRGKADKIIGDKIHKEKGVDAYQQYDANKDEIIDKHLSNAKTRNFLMEKSLDDFIKLYIRNHPEVFKEVPKITENNYCIARDDKGNLLMNGDSITIETPITLNTHVRVRCTCAHFYYTYAWYNANHNALIGARPPAYARVKGGKLYKISGILTERNQNQVPGLCKHLQMLISYLINVGVIKASSTSRIGANMKNQKAIETLKQIAISSNELNKAQREEKLTTAKREAKEQLKDTRMLGRELKLYGPNVNSRKKGEEDVE